MPMPCHPPFAIRICVCIRPAAAAEPNIRLRVEGVPEIALRSRERFFIYTQ